MTIEIVFKNGALRRTETTLTMEEVIRDIGRAAQDGSPNIFMVLGPGCIVRVGEIAMLGVVHK